MSGPSSPPSRRAPNAPARPARSAAPRDAQPLSEREFDELQALLDRVPAPLEGLDTSMLDGYLCGVLLQPRPVPVSRWLPHVTDVDGRALPPHFDAVRLHALVLRRHAELDAAIQRRVWFDPWVFELSAADAADDTVGRAFADGGRADTDADADTDTDTDTDTESGDAGPIDAVYPWVAGFATALELFPDLMALDAAALTEPLALVYRHLAPDDLEDADDLLAEIESLEPPQDLSESVEGLVRATLLLADISRPVPAPGGLPQRRPGPRR